MKTTDIADLAQPTISPRVKREIYTLLTAAFPLETPCLMAQVANAMGDGGYSAAQLGFDRFKDMLPHLAPMLERRDTKNPARPNVIIHRMAEWEAPAPTPAPPAAPEAAAHGISPDTQHKIYELLTAFYPPETPVAMIAVANTMSNNGYSAAQMGFDRFKDMLPHLAPMLERQNTEDPSRPNIVIHEMAGWEKGDVGTFAEWEPDEQRLLDAAEMKKIYSLLMSTYGTEEQMLSTIGATMIQGGFTATRYGFTGLKALLQEIARQSQFLTLRSVTALNGSTIDYVTLREKSSWGSASALQQTATDEMQNSVRALPDELTDDHVFMSPNVLKGLNRLVTGQPDALPTPAVMQTLQEDWRAACEKRVLRRTFIKSRRNPENKLTGYIFDLSLPDCDNNAIEAILCESDEDASDDRHKNWLLYRVDIKREDPRARLFAYSPDLQNPHKWKETLQELAQKAEPEAWDFRGDSARKYAILDNYLRYTFARVEQEGKIERSVDEHLTAFNTGLMSRHYHDIFACFTCEELGDHSFAGFCTKNERGLGKQLFTRFRDLPETASYLEQKEDLLFDANCELEISTDHILIDNVDRLPLAFLSSCASSDTVRRLLAQIGREKAHSERARLYRDLRRAINEDDTTYRRMDDAIHNAVDAAQERCRRNYRTAVPCFFPTDGKMSMLLPLALQNYDTADVALVVRWYPETAKYHGVTILEMQDAYVDARLICRLESGWLGNTLAGGRP